MIDQRHYISVDNFVASQSQLTFSIITSSSFSLSLSSSTTTTTTVNIAEVVISGVQACFTDTVAP